MFRPPPNFSSYSGDTGGLKRRNFVLGIGVPDILGIAAHRSQAFFDQGRSGGRSLVGFISNKYIIHQAVHRESQLLCQDEISCGSTTLVLVQCT